jgi:UDP-glucose-4-epimerase GalE
MSSRILVTGGAGYIGSHTCKELARLGYEPITYDDLSNGHREAVKWGPLEEGDVRDSGRLGEVIRQYKPAACIHFAGLIEVGGSFKEPELYRSVNVSGSKTLLDALEKHDIGRIIFSSSAAVYGTPDATPIPESSPLKPINPYGETKLAVEKDLADRASSGTVNSISLRYFNASGADPEGETGENHSPETHLVPIVLQAASGARADVTIFGADYETPDGTCIRDYVHVSDLAQAHVRALEQLLGGWTGAGVYNIGTGSGISVREVIETVRLVTGLTINVKEGRRRLGDPPVLVADPALAREALGWEPVLSGLGDIITTAWNWHRRQGAATAK